MSAQKVATGIALAALTALITAIGLPALLPTADVPAIQIINPAGNTMTGTGGVDDDDAQDDDAGDDDVGDDDATPVVPGSNPNGDDDDADDTRQGGAVGESDDDDGTDDSGRDDDGDDSDD